MAKNGIFPRTERIGPETFETVWDVYVDGKLMASGLPNKKQAESFFNAQAKEPSINRKPFQTKSESSGASPSPGAEYMSTGLLGLLFFLGLLNYYYDYTVGFERTAFANSFDIAIYVFFTFYFLIFKKARNVSPFILMPYFFLEFAVPYIANAVTTFVTFDAVLKTLGVLLVMPWWIIGCFFFNTEISDKSSLQYKIINAGMYIFVIIIIVVYMIPAIIAATITAPTGIVNTAAINQAKTIISDGWTNFKTSTSKLIEFQRCALLEPQKVCEERVYKQEALQRVLRENPLPEITTFTMEVTDFFTGGKIPGPYIIRNYVPVDSKVQGAILSYSCGFKGVKDSGTPDPKELQPGKTKLTATQNSISCQLDRSKVPRTAPIYHFNVTASQIIASGYKELILVGADYKKSILDGIPGSDQNQKAENDALRTSIELGGFIQERQKNNLFGPVVGEKDLLRPIIQDGYASGVGTELPLVYGVKTQKGFDRYDLAIFVKNNAQGKVKEIKSIHVIPDQDMRLEPDNCGIDIALIESINRNLSITFGEFFQVTSCQFVITRDLDRPSDPNLKTIKVNVVYDYILSKEVFVTA